MKRKKRKILLYYLLFLLTATGIYCLYAVLYRGKTEPDSQAPTTDTSAAVYTFSQFSQIAGENAIQEESESS